jgi:AmiR/NasT family two-component response regulator
LDEHEADDLAAFCRSLTRDRAPVVALLDFPRRERVEIALAAGAAAVLGKPWLNIDLVAAVREATHRNASYGPSFLPRAA